MVDKEANDFYLIHLIKFYKCYTEPRNSKTHHDVMAKKIVVHTQLYFEPFYDKKKVPAHIYSWKVAKFLYKNGTFLLTDYVHYKIVHEIIKRDRI